MGKSVKKVFKSAVKVATLGAIDGSKGGWLGGTKGLLNVATLGATDAVGNVLNPKIPTTDMSGLEKALQAQATNANVDLGLDNVVDTEVGGTASSMAGSTRRRRNAGPGGVASSLGVRV